MGALQAEFVSIDSGSDGGSDVGELQTRSDSALVLGIDPAPTSMGVAVVDVGTMQSVHRAVLNLEAETGAAVTAARIGEQITALMGAHPEVFGHDFVLVAIEDNMPGAQGDANTAGHVMGAVKNTLIQAVLLERFPGISACFSPQSVLYHFAGTRGMGAHHANKAAAVRLWRERDRPLDDGELAGLKKDDVANAYLGARFLWETRIQGMLGVGKEAAKVRGRERAAERRRAKKDGIILPPIVRAPKTTAARAAAVVRSLVRTKKLVKKTKTKA